MLCKYKYAISVYNFIVNFKNYKRGKKYIIK